MCSSRLNANTTTNICTPEGDPYFDWSWAAIEKSVVACLVADSGRRLTRCPRGDSGKQRNVYAARLLCKF
jgi:hypothetical protein